MTHAVHSVAEMLGAFSVPCLGPPAHLGAAVSAEAHQRLAEFFHPVLSLSWGVRVPVNSWRFSYTSRFAVEPPVWAFGREYLLFSFIEDPLRTREPQELLPTLGRPSAPGIPASLGGSGSV